MLGIGSPGELALGEIPAGAGPEPAVESKFHQVWSEPVRERITRGLAIALIASGATVPPIAPFPEAVAEAKWHQPWSEPVRVKPALPVPEQHVFEFDPVPFVKIDWFAAFSEPVRVKPGLRAPAQPFEARPAWPDINVAFAPPFSEPVRVRPRVLVPAAEQQFQPFDEDILFVDRWFAWWSEPLVKARPRLIEAAQQWLAFNPPFNSGAAQSEWSGPPPSLVRFQYQAFARAPIAPEQVSLPGGGGWYLPDPTKPLRVNPRALRPGGSAPRQVEPERVPPTFAAILAAQQPARLADVLGARFAAALPNLAPPALDLWLHPRAPHSPKNTIPAAVIDDIQDRLDAMAALRALDEEDQERKAEIVAMLVRMANGE